jgi:tetratricopeptide (TPR) repeat protein
MAGDYATAAQRLLAAIEHAQKFGSRDPRLATTLNDLALTYFRLGRYGEAEPLHLRALEIRERNHGPNHPDVAATLNDLAFLYVAQGRFTEAEPLHDQALEIRQKEFGPEHPEVARSLNNIGSLYLEQERYVEAELLYLIRRSGSPTKPLGRLIPRSRRA